AGRAVAPLLATARPPRVGAGHERRQSPGRRYDFLTSFMTRSFAFWSAFFGSFSSPFRYVSHPGWPIVNCRSPNLLVRIAWLPLSCAGTVNAQSAIHDGWFLFHLAQSDVYGASWPGAPRTLPCDCCQISGL